MRLHRRCGLALPPTAGRVPSEMDGPYCRRERVKRPGVDYGVGVHWLGRVGASGLGVKWKAFGRVNLTDEEMMRAMADCGCVELRFGIESGSDAVLERIKKGFTAAESLELIPEAIEIFPRVDTFYVWGYPFETMEDFNQSLFQQSR